LTLRRLLAVALAAVLLLALPLSALAAYTGTCTITDVGAPDGRRHWLVSITETEAASGSEATCSNLPVRGTIVSYKATLTAGTGTTIDPVVGSAAAFTVSTQSHVASNDVAAAHISNQDPVRYYSSTGTLYIRSTPNNAAADHSITTEILIADGWE
jgi:hypothetical protein